MIQSLDCKTFPLSKGCRDKSHIITTIIIWPVLEIGSLRTSNMTWLRFFNTRLKATDIIEV